MTDLTTSLHGAPLASDAPEWVHLMPAGAITGRDGRKFTLSNAAAVGATFHAHGVDLPIDYENQSETHKETRVGSVPAAGWVKDLKAKTPSRDIAAQCTAGRWTAFGVASNGPSPRAT